MKLLIAKYYLLTTNLSLAGPFGSIFEKGNISQESSNQCQPKGYRNSRIKIPHINHNYKLANFLNLTDNTRQTIANNKITIAPNQAAAKLTIKSDKTEYQLFASLIN